MLNTKQRNQKKRLTNLATVMDFTYLFVRQVRKYGNIITPSMEKDRLLPLDILIP